MNVFQQYVSKTMTYSFWDFSLLKKFDIVFLFVFQGIGKEIKSDDHNWGDIESFGHIDNFWSQK